MAGPRLCRAAGHVLSRCAASGSPLRRSSPRVGIPGGLLAWLLRLVEPGLASGEAVCCSGGL
eukprot:12720125-Alexandrium_andersonii.AAC.1